MGDSNQDGSPHRHLGIATIIYQLKAVGDYIHCCYSYLYFYWTGLMVLLQLNVLRQVVLGKKILNTCLYLLSLDQVGHYYSLPDSLLQEGVLLINQVLSEAFAQIGVNQMADKGRKLCVKDLKSCLSVFSHLAIDLRIVLILILKAHPTSHILLKVHLLWPLLC